MSIAVVASWGRVGGVSTGNSLFRGLMLSVYAIPMSSCGLPFVGDSLRSSNALGFGPMRRVRGCCDRC